MNRAEEILLPYWERIRQIRFPGLFRERRDHADRVTTFELFFDLVYVFAITRLSHLLLGHLGVHGLFQTALLLIAVWWGWMYTTWFTNWLDPDKRAVRFALLGVMFASLLMASVLPDAFGDRGLMFAFAYVLMQVGRNCFAFAASHERPAQHRNFQRILLWSIASAVFWLLGGLFDGNMRELLWVIAVAIDLAGPILKFWTPNIGVSSVADWDISGHHMAERCQLFLIIALGESILTTGNTYELMESSLKVLLAFIIAFIGSAGLWWIYFDLGADQSARIVATSHDAGRLSRVAYVYFHLPLVAGIILTAVGDELSIAHPGGETHDWTAFALLCGPLVFFVGQFGFKKVIWNTISYSRLAGIGILLLGFAPATFLPPWLVALWAAAVIVGVAIWDHRQIPAFEVLMSKALARESGAGSSQTPATSAPEPAVTFDGDEPDEPVAVDSETSAPPPPDDIPETETAAPPAPPEQPENEDDEIPRPPTF
jgi:low temperature requirement protein LtrA